MQTKTINVTPSWSAIAPVLIEVLIRGDAQGRHAAKAELIRMAGLADEYVTALKENAID